MTPVAIEQMSRGKIEFDSDGLARPHPARCAVHRHDPIRAGQ